MSATSIVERSDKSDISSLSDISEDDTTVILPSRKRRRKGPCLTIRGEELRNRSRLTAHRPIDQSWHEINREEMPDEDRQVISIANNLQRREVYSIAATIDRRFVCQTRHNAANPEDGDPPPEVSYYSIGEPLEKCLKCKAFYWPAEANTNGVFMNCCGNGKIEIPIIENYHPTMIELLTYPAVDETHEQTRMHFLLNIRSYSHILGMASVRADFDRTNYDNTYNNRWRPFVYKVHGAMYSSMPPLFNNDPNRYNHETAQYYMFDSDLGNAERANAFRNDNGICNAQVSLPTKLN